MSAKDKRSISSRKRPFAPTFEDFIDYIDQHAPTMWSRSIDYMAATAIGQRALHLATGLLQIAVNTVWWSCSTMKGGPPVDQLVRPLPWIFFLPCLIWLRIAFTAHRVVCALLHKPDPEPVDWVDRLQNWQRSLRHLRRNGSQAMALAEQSPPAGWVEKILAKMNGLLALFGLEMVVKGDQMESTDTESTEFPNARRPIEHKEPEENALLNLSRDQLLRMLEKKICPDSDSESVSDSFTLSSLSSPDYTIDSIASPVDNGLLMDNAQDMSSTLNISPNTIECAATIVSLAYASTNNTPQKTAQPEGDNVIGTTEHTKGAQHQHQLEEVNTPQPNEDNRASTSGTYNTNTPRPRSHSVICEGTPTTPIITCSIYGDDDEAAAIATTSPINTAIPPSVLAEKINATDNYNMQSTTPPHPPPQPSDAAAQSKGSDASPPLSSGFTPVALSKSKRRRLKKKLLNQQLDNKENDAGVVNDSELDLHGDNAMVDATP